MFFSLSVISLPDKHHVFTKAVVCRFLITWGQKNISCFQTLWFFNKNCISLPLYGMPIGFKRSELNFDWMLTELMGEGVPLVSKQLGIIKVVVLIYHGRKQADKNSSNSLTRQYVIIVGFFVQRMETCGSIGEKQFHALVNGICLRFLFVRNEFYQPDRYQCPLRNVQVGIV